MTECTNDITSIAIGGRENKADTRNCGRAPRTDIDLRGRVGRLCGDGLRRVMAIHLPRKPTMRTVCSIISLVGCLAFTSLSVAADVRQVAKSVVAVDASGENLLTPNGWRAWQLGFERRGDLFVCDNGGDSRVQRGASQTVLLEQTLPAPIVAVDAESTPENLWMAGLLISQCVGAKVALVVARQGAGVVVVIIVAADDRRGKTFGRRDHQSAAIATVEHHVVHDLRVLQPADADARTGDSRLAVAAVGPNHVAVDQETLERMYCLTAAGERVDSFG